MPQSVTNYTGGVHLISGRDIILNSSPESVAADDAVATDSHAAEHALWTFVKEILGVKNVTVTAIVCGIVVGIWQIIKAMSVKENEE